MTAEQSPNMALPGDVAPDTGSIDMFVEVPGRRTDLLISAILLPLDIIRVTIQGFQERTVDLGKQMLVAVGLSNPDR